MSAFNPDTSLAHAAEFSGLDAKWFQPFDVTDPFNGEQRLQGFLSQKPDHRYGALAITHVNGAEAPQFILATPKLHYPFGRDGAFHFPPVRRIEMHEKLDGTNVLAYRYQDAKNQPFLSYKLRLSAVVRNSRFGAFLDMWRELLASHPNIARLCEQNKCHVSFEMYGSRNSHLILYEAPLAVAALFGVRADAGVVPPSRLELLGVPAAPLIGRLEAGLDPVARYAELRMDLEKRNSPAENEKLKGTEGAVWHVEDESGRMTMWKCKPESVEEIHWTTGINKKAVVATCWNFLETSDALDYAGLVPLLLEEYTLEEIEKFRAHIDASIAAVRAEFEFREGVLKAYDAIGISIHADKGAVMRELAKTYSKADMKKVFSAIMLSRPG